MIYIGLAFASTLPDTEPVPLAIGAVGVAVIVPVISFPFGRTLWSAIDLVMRPLEPDEVASAEQAQTRGQVVEGGV